MNKDERLGGRIVSIIFLSSSPYSLLQDAESKSETSQAISAREHFVFTDTDGQVYHITVEGNTVKDGARIPPDVSPETLFFFFFSFFLVSLPYNLLYCFKVVHTDPCTKLFVPALYQPLFILLISC